MFDSDPARLETIAGPWRVGRNRDLDKPERFAEIWVRSPVRPLLSFPSIFLSPSKLLLIEFQLAPSVLVVAAQFYVDKSTLELLKKAEPFKVTQKLHILF